MGLKALLKSKSRENENLGSKQLHAPGDGGQFLTASFAFLGQIIYVICDFSFVKLEQQVIFQS